MARHVSTHSPSIAALDAALVLLVFLSLGCGSPTPTPVATSTPARTPKPTFTPVPTETCTPTPTFVPTSTPVPATPTPTATATRDVAINPLTGLRVADAALLHRRVLAVRIGNDPEIRPQEGLGLADVVYEEIMDGWTLTRFTALYLGNDVQRIRPIRSARLSSLAIVPQYDAALVHSGASDRIRFMISKASFVDLDEFYNSQPYGVLDGYDWRGRMYTSVASVHAYLKARNKEREEPILGYRFDPQPPKGGSATSIHIPYPQLCAVDWSYDIGTGRYQRAVQGKAHLEALTGKPITADNVILFYAKHEKTDIVEDSLGSTAIDIVMTGSGRAQVCRDGRVVECRWVQTSPTELIQYYDTDSNLVALRPGQTWIQLVPEDYQVTVK